MDDIKKISKEYFKVLRKRSEESRVYKPYQSVGLTLTEILRDFKHKSLYMKLAKKYDNNSLLQLAKSIAERKDVRNKGAYFMSMLKLTEIPKATLIKNRGPQNIKLL